MHQILIAAAPISMELVTLGDRRRAVQRLIRDAAKAGAKLVCLPEFVDAQRTHEAVAYTDHHYYHLSGKYREGVFVQMIQAEARAHKIGVLYGQCAFVGKKLLNLAISVDKRGKILGSYAKTHLAPDEGPEGGMSAGDKIAPLPTDFGPVGVVTCYEVNFPEIARTQAARGARFLYVPTAGNSDAYFTLARARAAENVLPLVFASYSMERGTKSDACGAGIVDAFGKVLVKTTKGTKVLCAEIDLDAPVGCPVWHGRWPKEDLRAFLRKRIRRTLYAK